MAKFKPALLVGALAFLGGVVASIPMQLHLSSYKPQNAAVSEPLAEQLGLVLQNQQKMANMLTTLSTEIDALTGMTQELAQQVKVMGAASEGYGQSNVRSLNSMQQAEQAINRLLTDDEFKLLALDADDELAEPDTATDGKDDAVTTEAAPKAE